MNSLPATIALAVIAIASVISGAIVTTSGADAAALWAIAGTAAGAIGGAIIPQNARNGQTYNPVTTP